MITLKDSLFAAFTGFMIGLLHFGALWWTVQRAVKTRYASLFVILSFLVRCIALALLLAWLGRDGLWRTLIALLGVLVSRSVLLRRLGLKPGITAYATPH